MKAEIKQYIVENIELIDNNEFDELYRHCPKAYTHHLTFALQRAGIQPELFMTKIPFCFMYGNPMIDHFVVPPNVEVIENNAFESANIKTIIFDNSTIRALETCCFAYSKLKHIQWPSSLFLINKQCFKSCHDLEELDLPQGLYTIGPEVFTDCRSLRKVKIPASVGMVGASAFSYCPNLTEVTFEKGSNAQVGIGAFGNARDKDSFSAHNPDLKIICYKDDPTTERLVKLGYKVSVIT